MLNTNMPLERRDPLGAWAVVYPTSPPILSQGGTKGPKGAKGPKGPKGNGPGSNGTAYRPKQGTGAKRKNTFSFKRPLLVY